MKKYILLSIMILSLPVGSKICTGNWNGLNISGNLREKTDSELDQAYAWYTRCTLEQATSQTALTFVLHNSTRAQMVFLEIRRRQDEHQDKLFRWSFWTGTGIAIVALVVSIVTLLLSHKTSKQMLN